MREYLWYEFNPIGGLRIHILTIQNYSYFIPQLIFLTTAGIWILVRITRWTMNTLIPLITLRDYRCQNSNWWAIINNIESIGTSRQNENKPQCGQGSNTTILKNAELDQSVKLLRHFFIQLLNLQIEETIINDELPDRWLFPELINVSPLKYDLRPHYPHKWSLRYFYHPWKSKQFVKTWVWKLTIQPWHMK